MEDPYIAGLLIAMAQGQRQLLRDKTCEMLPVPRSLEVAIRSVALTAPWSLTPAMKFILAERQEQQKQFFQVCLSSSTHIGCQC